METAASTDALPGMWMTGTGALEAIAGTAAAVNYLASLADLLPQTSPALTRRQKLDLTFRAITEWERILSLEMLAGLKSVPGLQIHGITDPCRLPAESRLFRGLSLTVLRELWPSGWQNAVCVSGMATPMHCHSRRLLVWNQVVQSVPGHCITIQSKKLSD